MLKLTRLNHTTVAINPDRISWVEASPDTTLCLVGGEKLIVREALEELIDQFVDFQRRVHRCRASAELETRPPRWRESMRPSDYPRYPSTRPSEHAPRLTARPLEPPRAGSEQDGEGDAS